MSGDGGPAISAQLSHPVAVALDSAENLYIADLNNNRIRKVTPTGTISTVAGSAQQGYAGDGGPATNAQLYLPWGVAVDNATGNLYIADSWNSRIRKVTPADVGPVFEDAKDVGGIDVHILRGMNRLGDGLFDLVADTRELPFGLLSFAERGVLIDGRNLAAEQRCGIGGAGVDETSKKRR